MAACGITAMASTITFTETVTTSGNLDGNSFSNALVTLSLTGDTGNVTTSGGGVYALQGTLLINVSGVGSDSLFDPAQVQVYQTQSPTAYAGFFADSAFVLFTSNNSFDSYALTTSIGPLSGTSTGYTGGSYSTTSGGSFYLAGPFNSDHRSTFTASVQSGVPEPGTWLLTIGCVAGALALRRFRRRPV